MTKLYLPMLAWLAVAGLPSLALGQPVGPEFQVNVYTTGDQKAPSVASDAAGNFVVVWESRQDGSGYGIFGRRYDSDGNPLSDEFQVNNYTILFQTDPSVASDPAGNFVVVWESDNEDGVFGRRFDANGIPLGEEFQVNTYITGDQSGPSVAVDPNGNFVVVWSSEAQDGYRWGIFGQRYDASGNPLGPEFQVNTQAENRESLPSVSSAANGNFVVVWQVIEAGYYGRNLAVRGQRFDGDGNALGNEFTAGSGNVRTPSVASDAAGNFVVVWDTYVEFRGHSVLAQRYDRNGKRVGNQFQVNTSTHIAGPRVSAARMGGTFVVVWENTNGQDGGYHGVFGQIYDRHGKRGEEFQVNTYTVQDQTDPSVALNANGNFVVVWADGDNLSDDGQDGSDYGVFGQRFRAGCKASVRVRGAVNTAGSMVPVQVHIAHHRPKTVTVRWTLSLLDASEQVVAKHISPPHTFEPGDVLDEEVRFQLPDDLVSGEYTLDLAVKQMAGTKGARTTLRVLRAE